MTLPNFSEAELRCKGSGLLILAPGFGRELQALRNAYGKPMTVTSCCRSEEHNRKIGGHPRSLHVCDLPAHNTGGTCAIDVQVTDREELIKLAWSRGWSIGLSPRFIHLDLRTKILNLPQVRFEYGR
jgi:hypothetical protein